jgi:hypothetical protein
LGLGVSNHTWSALPPWGYQLMPGVDDLVRRYLLLIDRVHSLQRSNGLAAAVYTQLTDVETECNGFLTYDREILKIDPQQVFYTHTHPPLLLPEAEQGAYTWSYTTNPPAADWTLPEFEPAGWRSGEGGFGTQLGPGVIVNTVWNTDDIWLRREFVLPPAFTTPTRVVMYHDEDAEVYLNGVPAVRAPGYATAYQQFEIPAAAALALRAGRNVMAVHCHQTTGGQYIDVGLIDDAAAP